MSIIKRLNNGESIKLVTFGPCFFADNLRENPWVLALQKYADKEFQGQLKIFVRGQGGVNSKWGIKHLHSRAMSLLPDYVMMEWAINDSKVGKGGVSKEESYKNLNTMVNKIKQHNSDCEIILWTTTPISTKGRDKTLESYYDITRKYAKANNIQLLDMYPEFKKLKSENPKTYWLCLTEDEGHLTKYGANKIVLPFLLRGL